MHNSRTNRSKIPHNKIIKKYLNGYSSTKLSKIAGISEPAIFGILKRNNIPRRTKQLAEKLKRKYNYEKIAERYVAGEYIKDLANIYKTDEPNIIRILKNEKIKLRGRRKGENHPQWKGGITHDHYGYRVQKEGKTHRIILEKYLKRKLKQYEDVHHIDGNKANNGLKNLSILFRKEHNRFETFLRFANLKQSKENLKKFCRQESKFLWRFTKNDYEKIKQKNKFKIINPSPIKAKNCKHCGRKNAGNGLCSQLYQRYIAKKRGYWKSSKGRISRYLAKYKGFSKITHRPKWNRQEWVKMV